MVAASDVDRLLERSVDAGEVPGVVALAADDDGGIYQGAFGKRKIGKDPEMTLDTIVWIASMTKAVTSVAVMQLVEQGRVGLDEPLSKCLPELGTIQVLVGFDPAGAPELRPPRRPITLRHLLTHTAGFSYGLVNADMLRYEQYTGVPGLGEGKNDAFQAPLMFDPGERWEYGISIDWVGKVVERLSGQSLEGYFREHVFGPLGMVDTGFVLRTDQRSRLASMHARQRDGSLRSIPFEMPQQPAFDAGGSGLYSTGPDYLRFLRMLLGAGQIDGVRVLRSETVKAMGTNQLGELTVGILKTTNPSRSIGAEFFPGMVKKWGLGHMVTTREAPTGRSAGSLAWAGVANTYYWIDPIRHVAAVFLTQILPFADTRVVDLVEQFEGAIYSRCLGLPVHGQLVFGEVD